MFDLSSLSTPLNDIVIMVVKILGIPFVLALVVGFGLASLRFPRRFASFLAVVVFVVGFLYVLTNID